MSFYEFCRYETWYHVDWFRSKDESKNGYLSYDEFKKGTGLTTAWATYCFNKYDTHPHDSQLGLWEYRDYFRHRYRSGHCPTHRRQLRKESNST